MKFLEWFPYLITNLNENIENSNFQMQSTSHISFNESNTFKSATFLSNKTEERSKSEANRHYNILDRIYAETTNAIPPTDENLNAISFCKRKIKIFIFSKILFSII